MTSIELPKDATGQEIPLNVDALYDKSGERLAIYAWEYMPQLKHSRWRVRFLFDDSDCKYHPDEYYLAPPDSWEKLEEDLKAVEDYGNSSCIDNPVCRYTNMVGKQCSECEFYKGTNCIGKMCADIADRIRKLRGED